VLLGGFEDRRHGEPGLESLRRESHRHMKPHRLGFRIAGMR
jgi:hypothetical protein